MYNTDKTVSASERGLIVSYTDTKKHFTMGYDRSLKFNSKFQKVEFTSKFQKIDYFTFNPIQKKLYSKIVYGFEAFTQEELNSMSRAKKFRISVDYTKANRILNRWKQEIVNEMINSVLNKVFPNSPIIKQMTSVNGYDDNLNCNISFKDLGITKKQIVNKLIEFGLLPQNFYQLA